VSLCDAKVGGLFGLLMIFFVVFDVSLSDCMSPLICV